MKEHSSTRGQKNCQIYQITIYQPSPFAAVKFYPAFEKSCFSTRRGVCVPFIFSKVNEPWNSHLNPWSRSTLIKCKRLAGYGSPSCCILAARKIARLRSFDKTNDLGWYEQDRGEGRSWCIRVVYFSRHILSPNIGERGAAVGWYRGDERAAWENEIVRYKSIIRIENWDSGQKCQIPLLQFDKY